MRTALNTLVTLGVLFIIYLLGCIIFARVVESRIQVHAYVRSMNRIRRYFADHATSVPNYVDVRTIYDDVPRFSTIGYLRDRSRGDDRQMNWIRRMRRRYASFYGNTGMLAVLNSGTFGAFWGVTATIAGVDDLRWLTLSAVFSFAIALKFHLRRQLMRFDEEERRGIAAVRFPSPHS